MKLPLGIKSKRHCRSVTHAGAAKSKSDFDRHGAGAAFGLAVACAADIPPPVELVGPPPVACLTRTPLTTWVRTPGRCLLVRIVTSSMLRSGHRWLASRARAWTKTGSAAIPERGTLGLCFTLRT